MRKLLTALVVVGLFTGLNLFAGGKAGKAPKKAHRAKAEKQTLELKGKVSKQEKTSKGDRRRIHKVIEIKENK